MRLRKTAALLIMIFCLPLFAQDVSELSTAVQLNKARKKGYFQHHLNNKKLDVDREQGMGAYNEEIQKWNDKQFEALLEYRKQKKRDKPAAENTVEYRAFIKDKMLNDEDYEKFRQKYVKQRRLIQAQSVDDLSDEEELQIYSKRPRYENKKRVLYGAKSKFGVGTMPKSGGNDSFNDGYAPAPPSNDFAPPPMDQSFSGDFPPPPPPPMPPMDDFGGDFPPPPPPDFGFPPEGF